MNPPPAPSTRGEGEGDGGPERVFTAYVRTLRPGREPAAEDFDRVWRTLRGVLLDEMRRRGLTTAPPSFLGVYGSSDWREDAVEELTGIAYGYVFVTRLRSLQAQLAVKDNIDGLVFRNVRNLLHERQREHDPVGYRAYQVLRRAVESAVESGRLEVLEGGPKPVGDTLLAIAGHRPDAPPPDDSAELARRRQALRNLVGQWNAELLPDLVTARGKQRDAVAGELAERLPELAAEGIASFRFRELLANVRADLRERWAAVLWQEKGGMAPRESIQATSSGGGEEGDERGFVRVLRLYRPAAPPDQELESRRDFRSLTDCVSSAVEDHDADRRTRRYLDTFWQFLRTSVIASEPIPSNRKIGDLLGIPRERLPELYEHLAALVRRCRDLLGRPTVPVNPDDGSGRAGRGGAGRGDADRGDAGRGAADRAVDRGRDDGEGGAGTQGGGARD